MKASLRFLRSVVIALAVAVAFWMIVLTFFEEKFIYFPSPYPEGLYHAVPRSLHVQDHWFTAEDGVRLHAWFVPRDSSVATLVMSHGNAGNLSHRVDLLMRLKSAGFSIFIYDYRGYGRSEGTPSEDGIYLDGRAAFDYAGTIPGVSADRLVLFGTSLGSAVAVDVATHRQPAALILETPFTSARDMAAALYPYLPVRYVLRTKFESDRKILSLSLPLLVIHGTEDSIVPIGLGRKLYDAARGPKEFYEIPGAGHNDTFAVGGREYQHRIREFLLRALPSPAR